MAIALSGTSSDGNNIAGTSSAISSENKKVSGGEMVGGCSVCSDDQGTEENPLVYCDGCEVAVHQACYGIVDVPPGSWFCTKCEHSSLAGNGGQNKIECELCPSKDGALKKTETGRWAHVVCALYIPEVRFGNNNTMEPIEIKHIQADRYNKSCYLCVEKGNPKTANTGAVMDCYKIGCKQSFHVTCAQAAGLLCEEAGHGPGDNVIYCGYCKHHFRKLKAGNRKSGNSLNNSSSSYLDSASDSSQDNDSRCNTTDKDKNFNRINSKVPNMPTSLSTSDSLATNSHQSQGSTMTTTTVTSAASISTSSSTVTPSTKTTTPTNSTISLTMPNNSTSSGGSSKTSAASNSASTPSKKKRPPKNSAPSSAATNNSSTALLTTTDGESTQLSTAPAQLSSSITNNNNSTRDVYDWSSKDNLEKSSTVTSNNVGSKNNKKKASSGVNHQQASSTKSPTGTNQSSSNIGYNQSKTGSPNLSLSTSPSLGSPSNSTKSTSSSSTSSTSITTASSSSTSNSPSPALVSPNVSNRGSAVRYESPLASNSKTGTNTHNNRLILESNPSNVALPLGQNSIQTRINLDNPKNDLKKNPLTSSSLLSAAVPMPHELSTNSLLCSSSASSNSRADGSTLPGPPSLSNNLGSGLSIDSQTTNVLGQGNSSTTPNTQNTVPPLIIPVPQKSTTNPATSKPAAKSKANPSSKSSRKKPSEASSEAPKVEPKAKASRSKKAPVDSNNETPTAGSKAEPNKGRSKGKAAAKSADSGAPPATANSEPTTKTQAAPAVKRKSRSASNESSTTAPTTTAAQPSPAKRARKKKADPAAPPAEPPPTASSNLLLNSQPLSAAPNTPLSTTPLMINTPIANNRLAHGLNSSEGAGDAGHRYYSPMISPYANFEHLNAPSLTRSSLSRLFTASSTNPNQPNAADDVGKAFEELRENTWSHLSKFVLDQAQQFDIPSKIGTLYALRSENEKIENRVRDMTMKIEQLTAMNARLDLPAPMLMQHLNSTSPNFSNLVSGLANSPKSLPTPSPGSAINKQPLHVPVSSFNHVPPGSLCPPGYLDRTSPLVSQTHSGINNIKSSSISTPSPPIGALMAHNNNNRAGLITVNQPFMSNVFSPMNSLAQLGPNPQGSTYYSRQ